MNHYNPPDAEGKPSRTPTPTEALIEAVHGDTAHSIVSTMLKDRTPYRVIAENLTREDAGLFVSHSWVTKFVNTHYRKLQRWERVS